MNRWKKSCCVLLSLVLCILSGCAQGDTSSKPQYRPRLIYYTIQKRSIPTSVLRFSPC